MLIASLILNIILAAAIWRLKGRRTVRETAHVVIHGGGGPGEEGPTK